MISGEVSGGVVGSLGEFDIHVGNCERVIKPLSISNDAGYVVEIAECTWADKAGYTGAPMDPNAIRIIVRGHPHTPGVPGYPHSLLPQYTDLSDVEFQIVAIVH